MAALEEIEAKIHEHREQLAQVNELLALSPTDAALLSLAADINAVLTVAYEERRIAKGEVRPTATTAVGFVPGAAAASSVAPPPLPAPAAAAAALAAAMSASAGVPPPPPPPLPPALPSSSSDAAAAAAGAAGAAGAAVAAGAAAGGRKWQVKERCMAQWTDGKYYVARVDSGTDLHTYRVTYLDFGDSAEVMSSQLLPYLPAPAALLKPGVLVRAVWPEDGLFYDAKVEGLGSAMGLFSVKFTKYKKAASEVAVNDIVLRRITPTAFNPSDAKDAAAASFAPTASEASSQSQAFAATGGLTEEEVRQQLALRAAPEFAASATAASAAAAAASGAAAGATGAAALAALKAQRAAALAVDLGDKASIPEELQILPSDSEQMKQMKLKKIKRLKNRHRRAVLEQAGEKKQNSWQQFTARAERVAGSVAGAAAPAGPAAPAAAAAAVAPAAGAGRAAAAIPQKPHGAAEKAIAKNKTALEALKVLGRKRKSIFASPDSIDGRVGVTGSGRPMTAYTDLAPAKLAKTAATSTPLPHNDA